MEQPDPVSGIESHTPTRMLKIERCGDFWKGLIKPQIRLTGQWLERAGFKPGSHVHVRCVAPGVIELRSPTATVADPVEHPSSEWIEAPF